MVNAQIKYFTLVNKSSFTISLNGICYNEPLVLEPNKPVSISINDITPDFPVRLGIFSKYISYSTEFKDLVSPEISFFTDIDSIEAVSGEEFKVVIKVVAKDYRDELVKLVFNVEDADKYAIRFFDDTVSGYVPYAKSGNIVKLENKWQKYTYLVSIGEKLGKEDIKAKLKASIESKLGTVLSNTESEVNISKEDYSQDTINILTDFGDKEYVVDEENEFSVKIIPGNRVGSTLIGKMIFGNWDAIKSFQYQDLEDSEWKNVVNGNFGNIVLDEEKEVKFKITFSSPCDMDVSVVVATEKDEVLKSEDRIVTVIATE